MIKELEKEFTGVGEVKGFEFRQINKSEAAYIYEVRSGDKLYYEILRGLKRLYVSILRKEFILSLISKRLIQNQNSLV